MKARQKRMLLVAIAVVAIGFASVLIINALRSNASYYLTPTKVANGEVEVGQLFRLGGMVVDGSLKRDTKSMNVEFVLTDYTNNVTVHYDKILPDLFKEKQSAVTRGKMKADGHFYAEEVLAKHDPTYMPPEVKESLNMDNKKKMDTEAAKKEVKE
ncbi:MAG: cytochrome c maturation protein CcmE [Thiotrichaceae bacterium]|nr:cytochrome c maturation protein CcmE [Thiotrichaceae bacterium]